MRRRTTKNSSKRKGEKTSQTLTDIDGEAEDGNKGGFNACYLLTSLSPRHKGHTYIGFTVNPKRRIRQHNGEITSGATRTKKKRPWEMILCIYGFPTQVAALQFEWAWQHPIESLAVRKAACNLKSLNGLPNKIKVAFTMLTLHAWQSMDLTVNFFSTKYMTHVADCPSLPRQIKVQFGSMDDLPCYSSVNESLQNDETDWDLDPQECGGSDDGIEDRLRADWNSADENRHCYDATATDSYPESQEDKESQQGQENNVFGQTDTFFLGENCFQRHFNEDRGCNQVEPFEDRSPLPKRDSFFLIEDDDDFQKQFYKDGECNLAQPFEGRSPLRKGSIADETQASTVRQIEVIDLFTPSPDFRNRMHSKKRKMDSADTDIIDLTRSPDFVQL